MIANCLRLRIGMSPACGRTVSTTAIVALIAMTASTWAQVPVFKLWVTEVYEVNPDGSYTPKCSVNCPTQDLLPGIAQPGDLINIEVTVEGWDVSTDSGTCNPEGEDCGGEGEVCSVSAQDCVDSHCSGAQTSALCTEDSQCFLPDSCDPDSCEKSPLMGAFQWTIDSSTYSNGGSGPGLAPAKLACTTDTDCACAYTEIPGAFNDCADFAVIHPGFCTCTQAACDENVCGPAAAAYIDSSSIPSYVFFSHQSVTAHDQSTLDYEFGAASLSASVGGVPEELFRCNAGARPICNVDADCPSGTCELVATSPYYLGTLLLEATGESGGLFTLDLLQETLGNVPITTFLNDNIGCKLPTPIVETLTIDFGEQNEDCNGNGRPDECDIDCGPPGGSCDRPGCGQSVDCNGNAVPDDCEADFDGDGVLDDCDACLDSDLAKLIAVEQCPTGVPNQLLDDGCTMNDVLTVCSVAGQSHGELTACVARHANEWRRQGLLSGKDVGRIAHCAGTSNERRPSNRIKNVRTRGTR